MANKASNNKQQKETTGNRQRKIKMEETKYSDSEHQGEGNKPYNFISASTRAKVKTKK